MAKPVTVRPTVEAGGGLPSNPLQFLEGLNRARSYQNAYIKAGWRNWEASLAAAEKSMMEEGLDYRAKLGYLKVLQDGLSHATTDLSDLSTARQKTLAELETEGFKAVEARDLAQAKLDAEAGKANADQRTKLTIADLKEKGDTSRANAKNETDVAIANARGAGAASAANARGTTGTGAKKPDPLKEFPLNEELINAKVVEFSRSGASNPALIRSAIDSLSTQISSTPGASTNQSQIDYTLFRAFDGLVDAYARQKGVTKDSVLGEVGAQFSDPAGTTVAGRIQSGQKISDIYTSGSAGTSGSPGSSTPSATYTPAKAATATASNLGPMGGTEYNAPDLGPVSAFDKNVGEVPYNQAVGGLAGRISGLNQTLKEATPILYQNPSTDIIGRAQDIYGAKFVPPPAAVQERKNRIAIQRLGGALPAPGGVATSGTSPDPLKSPADPLASVKAKAIAAARTAVDAYGKSVDDSASRVAWQDFESDDIAQTVKQMFADPSANPKAIQAQLQRQYAGNDPISLKDTERAMTAWVVYNSINKGTGGQ